MQALERRRTEGLSVRRRGHYGPQRRKNASAGMGASGGGGAGGDGCVQISNAVKHSGVSPVTR